MDKYITVELSSGTYTGLPVGPHTWTMVFKEHPMPQRPMGTRTNDADVEVSVNLPGDHPLMLEYVENLRDYNETIREAGWLNFFETTLQVPEGWDIRLGHKRLGIRLADDPVDRLIQYIRSDVILLVNDNLILDNAISGEITKEEVAASDRLFPGDEERQTVATDT